MNYYYTYKLDCERHTFRGDELFIRPINPQSSSSSSSSSIGPPILSAKLHTGHLNLHSGPAVEAAPLLATASYPTKGSKIELRAGPGAGGGSRSAARAKLTHSYVQLLDPAGRATAEIAKPKKSFWTGKVKDPSVRGCYAAVLPDGARVRWEGAPYPPPKTGLFRRAADKNAAKMRCVLVDGGGRSGELLGELMASNDVLVREGEGEG
ncbi:hypothetical protein UCREL1_3275 [Eutypa lata UCREL1]|uniref:Uncharacterized protein n=1 Tax=Eutypa lata (strain UCR-EL1) TaxID=1287681 RepID=M7TSS4_EUTLA|nr:hypothetical protein UCREL1_3275 [Eutypa lata UCREL1]